MSATDICKLCQRPEGGQPVDSHIIPRWLYKSLEYDGKPFRYKIINTNDKIKNRKGQGGIKEPLLCSRCDNEIIGKLESYAKPVINCKSPPTIKHIANNFIQLASLDYTKLKLFFLSILWRASVSGSPEFKHVLLGSKHENRISSMLLNGDAGRFIDYSFMITLVKFGAGDFDGVIMMPDKLRLDGYICYRFLFERMLVIYGVPKLPKDYLELALQENGTHIIAVKQAKEIELITTFAAIAGSQNKILF